MTANLLIEVVHYRTGVLIETQQLHDPALAWLTGPAGVRLRTSWGCGRPTTGWLAANPHPYGGFQ